MFGKEIMGEYKRLVSYIYSYEGGIKNKNVGFAKIESRNGICKVNISIRVADEFMKSSSDNLLEVYFFYRFGNRIKKILLEKMVINNGMGTAKLRMSADNIGNHQVGIDDIAGMFLCSESFRKNNGAGQTVYASEWDDHPIRLEDFMEKDGSQILQEPVEIGYNETVTEETAKTHDATGAGTAQDMETAGTDTTQNDGTAGAEAAESEVTVSEADSDNRTEDAVSADLNSILNEKREPRAGDYFKMLCGCYPKIRVSEIDGECVKITPHDISYLPKKYWSLCNNSFLLHGFYNYKYLLLCEKEEDGEKKYLICVPGLYHQKEQKVAGMFGFTEFEGDKNKDVMSFGYWCMYL